MLLATMTTAFFRTIKKRDATESYPVWGNLSNYFFLGVTQGFAQAFLVAGFLAAFLDTVMTFSSYEIKLSGILHL